MLGVDDIEALAREGITGPRTVLAHGVQLRPDEMEALAKAGTRFVHCPSANLKLASGIADVCAMRAAGIVVGLGSDGAPCNNRHDPFTELREAALLAKAKNGDARSMPAMEALEMATLDGARALGLEEVGSLERDRRADIVVVRIDAPHVEPGGDAVSRVVYACTAADVRHVVVDGTPVVVSKTHQLLDRDRVLASAREHARKLRDRAGI
jgi:5-methylthioadenosine/S-adenosylhomocysteine deaminase